jgi:hypothetical protein
MVHISWWGANVLLGSSLGEVPEVPGQGFEVTKETLYVQPRQRILNSLGYKQPPPDIKGKQRYGRCGDFSFYRCQNHVSLPSCIFYGPALAIFGADNLQKQI